MSVLAGISWFLLPLLGILLLTMHVCSWGYKRGMVLEGFQKHPLPEIMDGDTGAIARPPHRMWFSNYFFANWIIKMYFILKTYTPETKILYNGTYSAVCNTLMPSIQFHFLFKKCCLHPAVWKRFVWRTNNRKCHCNFFLEEWENSVRTMRCGQALPPAGGVQLFQQALPRASATAS